MIKKIAADALVAVHVLFIVSAPIAAAIFPLWVILLFGAIEIGAHWWMGDCPFSVWEARLRGIPDGLRRAFVGRVLSWLRVGEFSNAQAGRLTIFWFSVLITMALLRSIWG